MDRLTEWLDQEIPRLRLRGLSDRKIAYELNQDVKRISTRRHALGLPNFTGRRGSQKGNRSSFVPSVCKPHDRLIRELAAQGVRNREIAAACGMGVSRNAVIGWRYRNGI